MTTFTLIAGMLPLLIGSGPAHVVRRLFQLLHRLVDTRIAIQAVLLTALLLAAGGRRRRRRLAALLLPLLRLAAGLLLIFLQPFEFLL